MHAYKSICADLTVIIGIAVALYINTYIYVDNIYIYIHMYAYKSICADVTVMIGVAVALYMKPYIYVYTYIHKCIVVWI